MNLKIVNALIFDGVSADLTEGSVRIADGVIVETGDIRPGGPDGQVIDAAGRTVIPGLIDAHFHAYGAGLDLLGIEASSLSYLALMAARRLAAALSRGFTTVRDVAGGDAGLARAIGEGLIRSPRYLFTGPALSQTGGHGDPRPAGLDLQPCGAHMCEVVDGSDALRRAVRDRLRQGAHAIKVMTSGGVVSPTDPIRMPQYSAEEIRAVTEEATRRGSYVAAHAYSPEAIVHSVTNGVRSIEHGNLLDEQSARVMADGGAFLVPTLATYDAMERRGAALGLSAVSQAKNREVLDAGRHAVEIARAAGVPIGFGTDLMGPLEDEQLNGLRLQAEVDGPLAVLRAVTSVNADLLGRADLGRVAVGATADLLILDGNPLEQPSVLWAGPERRTVIKAGTQQFLWLISGDEMNSEPISRRAAEHVAAFNSCVQSGDWVAFADRFTPDATMRFVGIPVAPFTGREAIAAGYAAQPPSDTLTVSRAVSCGDVDEVWFAWDKGGGAGNMTLRWSGDLIAELTVAFA